MEKILHNVYSGCNRYNVDATERNGVRVDYSRPQPAFLLLNLAKYYYIIKQYQKAGVYLDVINNNLKSEVDKYNLSKDLDNLKKGMNLGNIS